MAGIGILDEGKESVLCGDAKGPIIRKVGNQHSRFQLQLDLWLEAFSDILFSYLRLGKELHTTM